MLDAGFRFAYRTAYKLMRLYWKAFRPYNRGALVAIWHEERVLLIKNSYVDYYCLPGGGVRPEETPRQAAAREVGEEVSLEVQPSELALALDVEHDWEGRRDHVAIFDLSVDEAPNVQVDNREVVSAEFVTLQEALSRPLFPPLRRHLEARLGQSERGGSDSNDRESSTSLLDRISGYPSIAPC